MINLEQYNGLMSDLYSELSQTSKMELSAKIINDFH